MAVYPPQLTTEEKNLKKRYTRLQEKRNLLRKAQEKPPQTFTRPTSVKPSNTEILSPKDAKAAAKHLLEAGKLKLTKKSPIKRTGFKRVGEIPGEAPPSKKANVKSSESDQKILDKKKIKAEVKLQKDLYSSFVMSSIPTGDLERIPKKQEDLSSQSTTDEKYSIKECTIYVEYQHPSCTEDALVLAFSRFGDIEKMEMGKNCAFITFKKPSVAETATKEMDKGMIRGSDIHVEPANESNDYIELPAGVTHPWSKLAAGKSLKDSPTKKKRPSQRPIKNYAMNDF